MSAGEEGSRVEMEAARDNLKLRCEGRGQDDG